jgi:hypothetical protein
MLKHSIKWTRFESTQFTTKIGAKTSLASFPVTHLMHYYAETDCSHALKSPNFLDNFI